MRNVHEIKKIDINITRLCVVGNIYCNNKQIIKPFIMKQEKPLHKADKGVNFLLLLDIA